jgi:hypothetical protein
MGPNPIYLGDSVYAFFDGNGIELRLERDDAPYAVYLEAEVLARLNTFWSECLQDQEHRRDL